MRRAPLAATIFCACMALSAQAPLTKATLEIQATFTESPRTPGSGSWSKTQTFTAHVPCAFTQGPGAAAAAMPAQTLVPGLVATYLFTPDKTLEGAHGGTFKSVEMDGSAATETLQAALIGPFSGSFGLAAGIHADDLVPAASNILTGFYKGTKTAGGRSEEWRETGAVLLVHPDLMNPMDPDMPRPTFSMKDFQAKLAAGRPFTMTAQKCYELDVKDKHYKGAYTLAISLTP
jgi:hypothetical protein